MRSRDLDTREINSLVSDLTGKHPSARRILHKILEVAFQHHDGFSLWTGLILSTLREELGFTTIADSPDIRKPLVLFLILLSECAREMRYKLIKQLDVASRSRAP